MLLEIGLDPRLAVRPVYDLSYSPAVFNEDECIAAALSLRKEPKMDEIDLEGLKDDLTVAKNNFKPQIDFVASWNKTLFTGCLCRSCPVSSTTPAVLLSTKDINFLTRRTFCTKSINSFSALNQRRE